MTCSETTMREPMTDADLGTLARRDEVDDFDAIELLVAEVRQLRDVLHDLDDFTARHSGPSRFGHDHVCYEVWMMLHARVRTLIGDDDE
jgi:hypothetical protein